MTTYFISDLHLSENTAHITALFMRFIKQLKPHDQLYILGDFFEAWVGDDAATDYDQTIIHSLQTLTKNGVTISLLYGNRDFLMRHTFFKTTGIQFLKDETVIDLNGQKTLLMHGDTLCTDDHSYLRYRKIVRNRLVQFLFLKLPLKKRRQIANKLRQNSQDRFQQNPIMTDVNQATVIKVMKKHRVTQLIHGHTHKIGIHTFKLDEQTLTRYVLGAWHESGSSLIADQTGKLSLVTISETGPE